MEDTIERVLKVLAHIVTILAGISTLWKNLRTTHKPKH